MLALRVNIGLAAKVMIVVPSSDNAVVDNIDQDIERHCHQSVQAIITTKLCLL